MNSTTKLAWHYTTGQCFKEICASGILLPASAGVRPPEMPVVWFSLDQHWEQTACKAWRDASGETRLLDMHQTAERGGGLVRFGADPRGLLAGQALRRAARMDPAVWRALVERGRAQGARAADWLGVVGPMVIDNLAVDVLNTQYEWEGIRQLACT